MRILGLKFARVPQIAVAASLGVLVGCLVWQVVEARSAARPEPMVRSSDTMQVNPTGRLGELLIAPPSFGSGALVPVIEAATVSSSSDISMVRVRGLASGVRGRRALVAIGEGPAVWIAVGDCKNDVCVAAVRRASVGLTIAGQATTVDLFRQRNGRPMEIQPVANAAPVASQPSTSAPSPGPPLVVDPVPAGGAAGSALAGGPALATQPQPPPK